MKIQPSFGYRTRRNKLGHNRLERDPETFPEVKMAIRLRGEGVRWQRIATMIGEKFGVSRRWYMYRYAVLKEMSLSRKGDPIRKTMKRINQANEVTAALRILCYLRVIPASWPRTSKRPGVSGHGNVMLDRTSGKTYIISERCDGDIYALDTIEAPTGDAVIALAVDAYIANPMADLIIAENYVVLTESILDRIAAARARLSEKSSNSAAV